MIKAFFFDLDGTLVDTHQANFLAYQKALQSVGVTINRDQFMQSLGLSAKVYLPMFAPGLTPAQYQAISDQKAIYYRQCLQHTTLNHELLEFIRQIKHSCQVALVTTARTRNLQAVLKHHKIADLFDVVVGQEDVTELKPHPEAYEKALQLTGLRPEEVVAFEDSETGAAAARAAGLAVITVKDFRP